MMKLVEQWNSLVRKAVRVMTRQNIRDYMDRGKNQPQPEISFANSLPDLAVMRELQGVLESECQAVTNAILDGTEWEFHEDYHNKAGTKIISAPLYLADLGRILHEMRKFVNYVTAKTVISKTTETFTNIAQLELIQGLQNAVAEMNKVQVISEFELVSIEDI